MKDPPEWGRGSYEKLLALSLGADHFNHPPLGEVMLAQVNADLGAIHASDQLGLFDESSAVRYFDAAFESPAPEAALEELEAVLSIADRPLPKLLKLARKHREPSS